MLRILSCVLLASTPVQTAAPVAPVSRWIAYQGFHWCSLLRVSDATKAPAFEIRHVPGAGDSSLLIPAALTDKVPQDAELVEQPSGNVLRLSGKATYIYQDGQRWPAIQLRVREGLLLQSLESASFVEVRSERGTLARLNLPNMKAAIAALNKCDNALLGKWGFDVAADRALASPPKAKDRAKWFDTFTYPASSMTLGEAGYVVARVTVDETGSVADCAIVAGSGSSLLDSLTCKRLRGSAHYEAARDGSGQPVRAQAIEMVQFKL